MLEGDSSETSKGSTWMGDLFRMHRAVESSFLIGSAARELGSLTEPVARSGGTFVLVAHVCWKFRASTYPHPDAMGCCMLGTRRHRLQSAFVLCGDHC